MRDVCFAALPATSNHCEPIGIPCILICIGELPGLLARSGPFSQRAHASPPLGSYPASYKSYRPMRGILLRSIIHLVGQCKRIVIMVQKAGPSRTVS
jgi:hypothetical protein